MKALLNGSWGQIHTIHVLCFKYFNKQEDLSTLALFQISWWVRKTCTIFLLVWFPLTQGKIQANQNESLQIMWERVSLIGQVLHTVYTYIHQRFDHTSAEYLFDLLLDPSRHRHGNIALVSMLWNVTPDLSTDAQILEPQMLWKV